LADRVKEKDAYDIAFILHHYQPTLADLAALQDAQDLFDEVRRIQSQQVESTDN
jgi:hypothetical protein